jgi:hypothetical protein
MAELEEEIKNKYYITEIDVMPYRVECKHRREENDSATAYR